MTCQETRRVLGFEDDAGRLRPRRLRRHLSVCPACRAEFPDAVLMFALRRPTLAGWSVPAAAGLALALCVFGANGGAGGDLNAVPQVREQPPAGPVVATVASRGTASVEVAQVRGESRAFRVRRWSSVERL